VLYDAAWHARMSRLFSGALRIWGVCAEVSGAPADANGFVIACIGGPEMRVRHDASSGWALTRCEAVSGNSVQLGQHAGLPGLLRRMREELAPDAPSGRLVIGAPQIAARGSGRL
jgi:hypothetical protein